MKKSKKSKSKKDKPLYDENGKWVDQDSRILSGIRRAYRLSPQMRETLAKARVELPPLPLKTGKPGKRVRVRFRCAECNELFSGKNVQVDHILAATPLWRSIEEMTWGEVVKGIFCNVSNLQVLCSTPKKRNAGLPSCHAKKSAEENYIRKLIKKDLLEEPGLQGIFNVPHAVEELMVAYKEKYQDFLIDKAEKLAAKEERKRIREAKKLAKAKK